MKIRTRKKLSKQRKIKPKLPTDFFLMDEFHLLSSTLFSQQDFPKFEGKKYIAEQRVIRKNSGKRLKIVGRLRHEDGTPVEKTPKKFYPKQVLNRTVP